MNNFLKGNTPLPLLILLVVQLSQGPASLAQDSEFQSRINKTKFHRHDGKKYRRAKIEKSPQYYLLYYSASWCGPCRATAPQLVEKYRTEIADDPDIALIHVSRDSREGDASKWAKDAGLPWLTVLPVNVGRSKLMEYRAVDATPFYALIDRDGNTLATGADSVFQKLTEMESSVDSAQE